MNVNALPPSVYPARPVLVGIVGSTVYGLRTATSDTDTLGVYLAETRTVLGLDGAKQGDRTIVFTAPQPDAAFHELGKFVRLALNGNPTVLELLYLPEYTIFTSVGFELVSLRDAFLSAATIRAAYGGYALSQAKRLLTRTEAGKVGFSASLGKLRVEKHGRHCLRLLLQGTQLLSEGTLTLNVSDCRDDLLTGGRLAVEDPAAFQRLVDERLRKLDQVAANTSLPDVPDRERVNDFLVSTRLRDLP